MTYRECSRCGAVDECEVWRARGREMALCRFCTADLQRWLGEGERR